MKRFLLTTLLVFLWSMSVAAAEMSDVAATDISEMSDVAEKAAVTVDKKFDVAVEFVENVYCSPAVVSKLNEALTKKLSADSKFNLNVDKPDYIVSCEVLGLGRGRIINNVTSVAFAVTGSASSMYVSPLIGPVIQAAGVTITNKRVFGIAVRLNLIRTRNGASIYKRTYLGRTPLRHNDVISEDVLDRAVESTVSIMRDNLHSHKFK